MESISSRKFILVFKILFLCYEILSLQWDICDYCLVLNLLGKEGVHNASDCSQWLKVENIWVWK